jgi:heptosyltransferase-2
MKKKCLIFFTIGIGDSLMVTPVMESIKSLPDLEFDALTISPQVDDIMQNSGSFKKVHFLNFQKDSLWESLKIIDNIRKEKYDISVLVFPSNHYKYRVVHFLTGAKKLFGMSYLDKNFPNLAFLSGKLLKEDRSLHAIEQNFRLFEFALKTKLARSEKMTINLNDTDRNIAGSFISDRKLENKIFVGLHPGSDLLKNMEKKRWGAEKYSELMKSYSGDGRIHFLIFGGKPEAGLNEEISSVSKNNSTVVKNVPFFQSAALIERCRVFICADTGLMHTAAALDVPVIAIFGPTSSVYTKPMNAGSVVVKKDYPCSPCYEYSRTPLFCDQEDQYKCMENISVAEIKEVLNKKLNIQEK